MIINMANLNWIMIENVFIDIDSPYQANKTLYGFDKEKIHYILHQLDFENKPYRLRRCHCFPAEIKKFTKYAFYNILNFHFHITKNVLNSIDYHFKEDPDTDQFIIFDHLLSIEPSGYRSMCQIQQKEMYHHINLANLKHQNIHPKFATILANYFNTLSFPEN